MFAITEGYRKINDEFLKTFTRSVMERETDLEKLTNAMREKHMPLENYKEYLDLRKFGTVEHSGFGLGFDRLVMYATGIGNIRDVLQFPRAYKHIY